MVTRPASVRAAGDVRRGFVAMLPLWPGGMSFAVAFAVLARASGLDVLTTQALSMIVFAGSAQVAMVLLSTSGASAAAIVATALVLNLRHVLYGLSLGHQLPREAKPPRWALAAFLTDETYGMTLREVARGKASAAFLFGAGVSWYGSFCVATLVGALLGTFLPDPRVLGLDFIFPLLFLAILLPLLRTRRHVLVACLAGGVAFALDRAAAGGVAILVAGIGGAAFGAFLDSRVDR